MIGTACCAERRRKISGDRRRQRREGLSMALGRRASGPGVCEPQVLLSNVGGLYTSGCAFMIAWRRVLCGSSVYVQKNRS